MPEHGEIGGLRLDDAVRLLRQSGYELPAGTGSLTTARLQEIIDGLCELSSHDALTGLPNIRLFRWALSQELDRVVRTGAAAALLLVDGDHFKSVNDRYGHQAGDHVLRTIAARMRANLRPMDTPARYGGEEFTVILPNCLPARAFQIAERIRAAVSEAPVELPDGRRVAVTVSVGGACVAPWQPAQPEDLIAAADRQLYRAKRNGRNCIAVEAVPDPGVTVEERDALLFTVEMP